MIISPIRLDHGELRRLAETYVWWMTPEEAIARPARLAAQVMNIGDYDDVQILAKAAGDAFLRSVIAGAEAGQFTPESWTYWHYRLGLAELGQVPPLPGRYVAGEGNRAS